MDFYSNCEPGVKACFQIDDPNAPHEGVSESDVRRLLTANPPPFAFKVICEDVWEFATYDFKAVHNYLLSLGFNYVGQTDDDFIDTATL